MWLGAGLFPCLSVSTITVFSTATATVPFPYQCQRGAQSQSQRSEETVNGECVEHDILIFSLTRSATVTVTVRRPLYRKEGRK